MDTNITSLYFDRLKKKVLDIAGLKNISAADCKTLSISLSKRTNKPLSVTTVKRIYGFAHAKFAASAFTMDILAEFCGFDNWNNYIDKFRISGSEDLLELSEHLVPLNPNITFRLFLDNLMICIILLSALYNKNGEISDFKIVLANKAMEDTLNRRDLPGKLYSQEFPGTKVTGLYEVMLKVMKTGQPERTEYHYPYDGLDSYYSSLIIKTKDGLLTVHHELSDASKLAAGCSLIM